MSALLQFFPVIILDTGICNRMTLATGPVMHRNPHHAPKPMFIFNKGKPAALLLADTAAQKVRAVLAPTIRGSSP